MTDPKAEDQLWELVQRQNVELADRQRVGHMVTVERLIDMLEKLPYDAFVVVASDAEGNNYSPLVPLDGDPERDLLWYTPQTRRTGSAANLDDPDGPGPEPMTGDLVAVVLWPVN